MQTSLEKIANKAREQKNYRFRNLYTMLSLQWLIWSFNKLNKGSAPGIDGIGAKEYGKNLLRNLIVLFRRLKQKTYKAKLVKRRYIEKANGKLRPLGIPATEDKVLQVGVKEILQAIYEQDFLDCSYGYRPERNPKDAVGEIREKLRFRKLRYVVEADIKGFFDAIDHDWLVKMLELRIDDRALMRLIKKWLKAGIMEPEGNVVDNEAGTPQGGIISPLLANVYLHYVLDLWFEKAVKKQLKGEGYIVRYADDFICMFQYKDDADRFYRALPGRLQKFNLQVAPDKTKIVTFNRWNKKNRFEFVGFEFYWDINRKGQDELYVRTSNKKLRTALKNLNSWFRENRHKGVKWLLKEMNLKLLGHYNYYGVRGNYKRIQAYHYYSRRIMFKWLNRRSQRKSYNWDQFADLLKHKPLEKPRITAKPIVRIQYGF